MQKSGDGSNGPIKPQAKPRSTILGVRTVQGAKPGELPAPMVEILAKESEVAAGRRSEPQPEIEIQEDLDITEIKITERERYRVERVLGQGGFGIVYQATHFVDSKFREGEYVFDEPVAIKVISFNEADLQTDPSGPEGAKRKLNERFETEVRLAKKLKNENIVQITNYAQLEDGRPFYVMELLRGMDLGAIIGQRRMRNEGPLEWEKIGPVMLQVCSALEAAHNYEERDERKPIIHRDIKPENIFIETSKAGEWRVKVLDFGLAKLIAPSNPDATKKGDGVGGSPWYMSPEQAWGLTVDERSDIWSVGATMYELVTGLPPFEFEILDKTGTQTSDEYNEYRAKKWAEIRDRLWNEKPKPFSVANPQAMFPEEVEEIVFKCLEKKPEHRFQNVAELKEAIAKINGQANGNGSSKPNGPAVDPPQTIIIDDCQLVDHAEGVAGPPQTAAAAKRATPPEEAGMGGMNVPDLSDEEEDHRTIPRPIEKTEIVRIRNTAQDPKKRPTMQGAGPRKKLSKWLLIGTLAGSVAAAGIGVGIVYSTSRGGDRMPADAEVYPPERPSKVQTPGKAPPLVPHAARDAGTEAGSEAASDVVVSPLDPDASAGEADTETTPTHAITLNTGVPGVQVLIGDSQACRTGASGACTIDLPADSEAIRLTFRKRGYVDSRRDVVPDQDRDVRVTMERVQVRPPGPTKAQNHTPRITSE